MPGRVPVYLYTKSQHDLILQRVDQVPAGQSIVIRSHNCLGAFADSILQKYGAAMKCRWLQSGPDWWSLELERV